MNRRTQQTVAAFAATFILIAGLCGFIAVDLSTERYMPGQYGPLLLVTQIGPEGVDFYALGEEYRIEAGQLDVVKEYLIEYRGLLPNSCRIAGMLSILGEGYLQELLEEPEEEPWW